MRIIITILCIALFTTFAFIFTWKKFPAKVEDEETTDEGNLAPETNVFYTKDKIKNK